MTSAGQRPAKRRCATANITCKGYAHARNPFRSSSRLLEYERARSLLGLCATSIVPVRNCRPFPRENRGEPPVASAEESCRRSPTSPAPRGYLFRLECRIAAVAQICPVISRAIVSERAYGSKVAVCRAISRGARTPNLSRTCTRRRTRVQMALIIVGARFEFPLTRNRSDVIVLMPREPAASMKIHAIRFIE
jgi:hypothetical protein